MSENDLKETGNIDWNDPNLDLDAIIGISDIDKVEGFTTNNVINLCNLDLKELITDDTFLLYNGEKIVGAIRYKKGEFIDLKYLASINHHRNNYESDDEFNHFVDEYFDKSEKIDIPGIGKELLKRFFLRFKSNTEIKIVSLSEAENFYKNILTELEKEGKLFFEQKGLYFKIVLL